MEESPASSLYAMLPLLSSDLPRAAAAYWLDKLLFRFLDFSILGKTATRNNAVHMYMVKKFLVPGMKYLNNSGRCTQIFFVCRDFQECFSSTFVKPVVEAFLIAVDERVQFVWKCKDHMKIRCINHL